MARVTGKLQITLPRAVAERFGIHPGDEVEIVPREDVLCIVPSLGALSQRVQDRLRLFDQATRRQRDREAHEDKRSPAADRGWSREDLYDRGRSR